MCGIVGVLEGDASFEPVDLDDVAAALDRAYDGFPQALADDSLRDSLARCAADVEHAEELLRGVRGIYSLAMQPQRIAEFGGVLDDLWTRTTELERDLDTTGVSVADLETLNVAFVRLKDATWKAGRDHIRNARTARELAGRDATPHAVALFGQIEIALSAIDRLEVRGRDSAGIAVFVRDHGLDLDAPSVRTAWTTRSIDPLLRT